jgi:hypothetical protein
MAHQNSSNNTKNSPSIGADQARVLDQLLQLAGFRFPNFYVVVFFNGRSWYFCHLVRYTYAAALLIIEITALLIISTLLIFFTSLSYFNSMSLHTNCTLMSMFSISTVTERPSRWFRIT